MTRTEQLAKAYDSRTYWTRDMDFLLEQVATTQNVTAAARMLGVKPKAAWDRASCLGIKSARADKIKYTPEFCDAIIADFCTKSVNEIALERGMKVGAVKYCILRARGKR